METAETVSLDIHDNLATLSLGQPDERTVTLSLQRMESLDEAVDRLRHEAKSGTVRGVVVRGATPKLFCAGADLKLLRALQERNAPRLTDLLRSVRQLSDEQREQLAALLEEQDFVHLGEQLSLLGKEIFERLSALEITSVAAISGACVGGGLELALHCDWIVAAESSSIFADGIKTELAFPEPMLGLLEGWGGIELTVRRIGLRSALPLLMRGRSITPEQALRLGVIDAVVAGDKLYDHAASVARGNNKLRRRPIGIFDRLLTRTAAGRRIVSQGVRLPLLGQVMPGARDALSDFPPGHYPAPHAILEVALCEAEAPPPAGSRLASRHFGELAASPQSESLVHVLFFGTEAAKARAGSARRVKNLNCLVIGAGQMGAGIAYALLRSGQRVVMHDVHRQSLDATNGRMNEWIKRDGRISRDDKAQMRRNIRYEQQLPGDLSSIDFAMEAVIEDLAVKQQVLTEISQRLSSEAIIATNTSSIPIGVLAESVVEPQRFFGMHYFNPVRKMRLVEIIQSRHSTAQTATFGAALAVAQGKYPVAVRDVPGFLVNRMLFPYLNEAVKLVLEGHAIEAIDAAAEQFGMIMGPLKTLDLVGFDVAREVAAILTAAYAERMQTPELSSVSGENVPWDAVLDALALRKVLGKKAGRGFYLYGNHSDSNRRWTPNPIFSDTDFFSTFGASAPRPRISTVEQIQERLISRLLDEANCCLREGVAGDALDEAALQIDLASVLGFGFAPFRGGIIHYGEKIHRAVR